MSTSEDQVRLTLFVPGTPASLEVWGTALAKSGWVLTGSRLRAPPSADAAQCAADVEVRWVANDGDFGKAFSFGSVPPAGVATIDALPGALVLHLTEELGSGREHVLAVVKAMQAAGAVAVRVEESKMGWEVARWLELLSGDDPWDWHYAVVTFLRQGDFLQSCGMHAFSRPDVCVPVENDASAQQEFGSVLNVYQIAEDPLLLSGQTFAPDADTPRRVVERWPDTAYPASHACHNPYGVWRVGEAGSISKDVPSPVVFMPPLVALLRSMEDSASAPLTQQQVESVRDNAPCIAMAPREAAAMERARGYADVDPERVWAHWQLVRASLE